MPGGRAAEMNESAGVVEKSRMAQSAQSAGSVTRKEATQDELLEILGDLLRKIGNSGTEIRITQNIVTRKGEPAVGFLVMGVEVIDGRLRRIVNVPEKTT